MTKKKYFTTALLLTALIIVSTFAAFLSGVSRGKAAELSADEAILPRTDIEYTALNSPVGACYFDGNYAVIEGKTVRVFTGDETIVLKGFISLKQIKFLSADKLYASDDGSVYQIDLAGASGDTDLSTPENSQRKTRIAGGSFFDFNDKYLITVYGSQLIVYTMGETIVYEDSTDTANDNNPIAINGANEIYYHSGESGSKLCKSPANNLDSVLISDVSASQPSKMVADNRYVYFVAADGIFRISTSFPAQAERLAVSECDYELGSIVSPNGISFKGDNLLITDSATGAIQEFKVGEDGTLAFTGYAIASGKTAFNRISANATDIERFGDNIAVLDENKLTVINETDFDAYSEESFVNLFVGSEQTRPVYFALGNGTVLFSSYTELNYIEEISETAEKKSVSGISNTVKDLCYQSGFYYVLTTDAVNSYVYKISEKDFEISGERKIFAGITAEDFTVDVKGNVYAADQTTVYKNKVGVSFDKDGAEKFCTDLAGVLFAFSNGEIRFYNENTDSWTPCAEVSHSVRTFAMSFDKQEVVYLTNEPGHGEYIYKTQNLGNLSISGISVPQGFLERNATQTERSLSFYSANDGFNLYSVSAEGNFALKKLAEKESEYVKIADISLTDATGAPLVLRAMAAQEGVVIADAEHLETLDKERKTAPENVYVTTDVNLYHLPVITAEDAFTATNNGSTLRLNKGAKLSALYSFDFLGIEYYAVKINVSETEYFGFAPLSFTVEILSEDLVSEKFTFEKVSAGTFYKDENLSESLLEFSDNQKVRVISETNGVCRALYAVDGGFIEGYFSASLIKDDAGAAVRNILVILAVAASVCGTASYFILRKKKD